MKMNEHPKPNTPLHHSRQSNSTNYRPSMAHPGFLSARKLMICLGWLRLYQTILLNRSRTRHAKVPPH